MEINIKIQLPKLRIFSRHVYMNKIGCCWRVRIIPFWGRARYMDYSEMPNMEKIRCDSKERYWSGSCWSIPGFRYENIKRMKRYDKALRTANPSWFLGNL